MTSRDWRTETPARLDTPIDVICRFRGCIRDLAADLDMLGGIGENKPRFQHRVSVGVIVARLLPMLGSWMHARPGWQPTFARLLTPVLKVHRRLIPRRNDLVVIRRQRAGWIRERRVAQEFECLTSTPPEIAFPFGTAAAWLAHPGSASKRL